MVLDTLTLSRAGTKGGLAFKHKWTDDEREIVRREYKGTSQSARLIAARIAYLTREHITQFAVKGQVQRLGIARDKSPVWTDAEVEVLREMINQYFPITIARKLGRSVNAVVVKSKRLGLSRRVRDGWFVKREVGEICGVDHRKVQSWIDSGELKAGWHTEVKPQKDGSATWHILEADLRVFLLSHCGELQGRNVDLFQIVSIINKI